MKHNRDLTPAQIAERLRQLIKKSKALSVNKWAAANRVSKAHVSRVLNSLDAPNKRMREILGIERVVVFRVKGNE